jgi:Flp pilus assembly protein protease CpaA
VTLALAIVIVFGMLAWAAVADIVAWRIPNAISAIVAIAFCFASIGAPSALIYLAALGSPGLFSSLGLSDLSSARLAVEMTN